MLSVFPDYGKAGAEYLLSVTELLAEYPPDIQDRIANHRTGVPSLTKFLPTAMEITAFGDELMARRETAKRYANRVQTAPQIEYKGAYIPFPSLWTAFADEMDLLRYHQFDRLEAASKALAMHGKDAARKILKGHDPSPGDAVEKSPTRGRTLAVPTAEEVKEVFANLKTPSEPISDELRQLLAEQDAR